MGISKKTIYKYFSSKDELINTVIIKVMEPFIDEVNNIIDKDIPVSDAFQLLLKAIQKLLNITYQSTIEHRAKHCTKHRTQGGTTGVRPPLAIRRTMPDMS